MKFADDMKPRPAVTTEKTGIPCGKNSRNLRTAERNDMKFNGRNTKLCI